MSNIQDAKNAFSQLVSLNPSATTEHFQLGNREPSNFAYSFVDNLEWAIDNTERLMHEVFKDADPKKGAEHRRSLRSVDSALRKNATKLRATLTTLVASEQRRSELRANDDTEERVLQEIRHTWFVSICEINDEVHLGMQALEQLERLSAECDKTARVSKKV